MATMNAHAYLMKEKLFTFELYNQSVETCRKINFDHFIHEHCIVTSNTPTKADILLANKIKVAISGKPLLTRKVQIKMVEVQMNKGKGVQFEVNSCSFRDMFLLLGDKMTFQLVIGNPQVEVAHDKPTRSTVTAMLSGVKGDEIYYSSGPLEVPDRWDKYWSTSLKIKFSASISLSFYGKLVVPKELDESVFETEDSKLSIPKKLLEEKLRTDMTIIASNGVHVDCHKIFLEAQSSVFCSMMEKDKFLEGKSNIVQMDDISETAVNALLAFLYYWGIDEPLKNAEVAVQLLQASQKYDIKSLEKSMTSILLTKSAEWFDIPTTIKLFFFSKNVDELSQLKTKSLHILKLKNQELVNSEDFKTMFKDDYKREDALELCTALLLTL